VQGTSLVGLGITVLTGREVLVGCMSSLRWWIFVMCVPHSYNKWPTTKRTAWRDQRTGTHDLMTICSYALISPVRYTNIRYKVLVVLWSR